MKFLDTAAKTGIGGVGIAAISVFAAATALAQPAVEPFGTGQQLVDGPMVTTYTVSQLQPSTATITDFQPAGNLYQADVTAKADSGTVTPLVADFNARTADGQTYRMISTAPMPDGINPAPIGQGGQSSGKIYFDVTGQPPNGVVYNDGVRDVLTWTNQA